MPAAVETMMFTGEVPWHGLGTYVEEAPTSKEALRLAGLDWKVELFPVFAEKTVRGRPARVVVPEQYAVIRDSDHRALGVVGRRYSPVQNVDAFAFADALAGGVEDALRFETAGSLHGGRMVWILARLHADNFEVATGDEIVPYLLLANRHDGGGSFLATLCQTRVVCKNTYNVAIREGRSMVKIAHVGDVMGRIDEAQRVLGLARETIAEQREIAERCRLVVMDGAKLDEFVRALYPDPTDDAAKSTVTRTENKRENLVRLFEEAPGNDLPGVRGTGWAAVNAVTYLTSHEMTVRGRKDGRSEDEKRLNSVWFGTGASLNARAFDAVLSLAA